MINLPFWAITEHIQVVEIERLPCSEQGKAALFSSASRLFEFVNAHLRGQWKMCMVADRDGLIVMIADFHRSNIQTIVVDPELNGSGGQEVPLTDLLALAEELKTRPPAQTSTPPPN